MPRIISAFPQQELHVATQKLATTWGPCIYNTFPNAGIVFRSYCLKKEKEKLWSGDKGKWSDLNSVLPLCLSLHVKEGRTSCGNLQYTKYYILRYTPIRHCVQCDIIVYNRPNADLNTSVDLGCNQPKKVKNIYVKKKNFLKIDQSEFLSTQNASTNKSSSRPGDYSPYSLRVLCVWSFLFYFICVVYCVF